MPHYQRQIENGLHQGYTNMYAIHGYNIINCVWTESESRKENMEDAKSNMEVQVSVHSGKNKT